MDFFQISVDKREETGKGPMRRLRGAGFVPGVLYGLGRPTMPITLPRRELQRFFDAPSHLIELRMGDKARQAIVREVQIDAITDEILHVDFHRVEADVAVQDNVRLNYKGTAIGTTKGGMLQTLAEMVEISAIPRNIPHEIVVDISGLELGDGVRAAEVALPEGVELITTPDTLLIQVAAPKMEAADEEEAEEGAEEPAADAS